MSLYTEQELGGYANDSGCPGCGQPMVRSLRSLCRACSGEQPEAPVFRATASFALRLAVQMARRKLSAYSTLAVQDIQRALRYHGAWREGRRIPISRAPGEGERIAVLTKGELVVCAMRAEQAAYEDIREAARAAFLLRPDLSPRQSSAQNESEVPA